MSDDITERKQTLEFKGGMAGLLVPFAVLFAGILFLSATGNAMPMSFWIPALAALATAIAMSKNPTECANVFVGGVANEMVAVMIMAWILAGIVAQIMKETGVVSGLLYISITLNLKGSFYPAIAFIASAVLSTSTGTSLGSIIALTPILYPVGVTLGANPAAMLGAIISGGYFGDNIAPVSDTTIASAYTQGIEVAAVVRSRLKYAFVSGGISLLLFIILGGGGASGQVELPDISQYSPKGLIMLIVPALLILLMYRGMHMIVALVTAAVSGIVLGLVSGLLLPSRLLTIDMNAFSVSGVVVEGALGVMDITVFAMILMGLINLLNAGGFFDLVMDKLSGFTKTPRSAEFVVAIMVLLTSLLTVANTVAIVMVGSLAKRILVEKHHVAPNRSANILDAVSCAGMCIIPYAFGPLLAFMFAGGSGLPVTFSLGSIIIYSFHGWGMLAVMMFAITTGWGRSFTNVKQPTADFKKGIMP